jgi:uncharacterized protein YacL (UPF0231 family)
VLSIVSLPNVVSVPIQSEDVMFTAEELAFYSAQPIDDDWDMDLYDA